MFLRRCVYGLCITVTMLIIFGFSSQPAEVTRRTSNIIVTPIENVLKQSLYDDTNEAKEWKEIKKIIVKIVRKSAHFFLYFLLSIFVFLYIENSRIRRNLNFLFSCLFTIMYAYTDEFHQTFVLGRTGRVSDVLIDATGAVLGVIFVSYIIKKNSGSSKYR